MSKDTQTTRSRKLEEYIEAWSTSIGRVLQEVTGTPQTSRELSAEATQACWEELKEEGLGIRFEAVQHLTGEQGFVLSKSDAVRLAQSLLTEPQDGTIVLSDDHRDAVGELFRQFAGAAASAVKGLAGGEVNFKWSGMERLAGDSALRIGLEWSSSKLQPFTFIAEISPALFMVLDPPPSPAPPALELPSPLPPATALVPTHDPKLELLMDVELDVTLRFGQREMTLRDILDLNAGSVVELDQNLRDPVDLLVGGKVIARGEVVVVDGNYGFRVMEISSPLERIDSLRK